MKTLKISTKLSLGFFLIVSTFLALTAFSAWKISQVSKATASMEVETQLLNLADKWQADVRQNSARSLAAAYAPGPAMFEFFKADMAATSAQTTVTQKTFLELAKNEGSIKRAQAVGEVRKTWLATREQANALKTTGDEAGTQALVQNKLVPATADYIRVTQDLVDGEIANVHETHQEIETIFNQLFMLGSMLLALCIGIAVFASWSISRSITSGIGLASSATRRIGEGDLSHNLPIRRYIRHEPRA